MNAIYLALTVAILFVNSAALAQLFARWFGDRHLARAAGILAVCTPLFFVEHLFGLGKLAWLWPLTSIAAVALLRGKLVSTAFWRSELPFIVPFFWALAWRFAFPNIDGGTEHLADLYFVANYINGDSLPPPDQWLPGYKFNFYYSYLHYCTALLGRWLGVGPGMAMNLGDVVVFALLGSLAWSVVSRFVTSTWVKTAIVVGVIVGGTGVSPLLPMLYNPDNTIAQMWGNTRFAGMFDQDITTVFGQKLFPKMTMETAPVPGFEPRDLPLETLSYYLYLGDLHPPLASFILVFFTLGLFARLEKPEEGEDPRPLLFAIGSTLALPLALNIWALPVQGFLVVCWLLYRWTGKQVMHWRWLVAGALTVMVLIYPYLTEFVPNALATPIALTDRLDHTPWRQGLAIWWPVLWLVVLAILHGPRQRLVFWSGIFVTMVWLITEFIVIDDPMGGRYQRFNTVLKWWSWLYPVALLWLTALVVSSQQKWARVLALVPVLLVSLYLIPQALHWKASIKGGLQSAGRLQGDGWLRADETNRTILNWLRTAPRGNVLESFERGSYSNASAFALHSGQPSAMGWVDHINLWRANPAYMAQRAEAIRALYQGELPTARDWLKTQNVRYVVWSKFDTARGPQTLATLQQQLAPDYVWIPLWGTAPDQYGVFKRLYY
ncbi:hypothetical protein IGB42_00815 [Andreprevotia sp. IGB-42]|uniref:DUF2298 domain-containing protein n=1 Tax=Andreprevotia sp. IGB-42 TaxID=2497473 RepID=UPI00135BB86D|nr:DUF2298 domain-containing protein [Andreprevotia sp. IGB-42]KAF0814760.1 hypothetical protein IGB42_00815 [Andreprevotia sp. IGB-42]